MRAAQLISICLCTFKRPELRKTLESLNALNIPENTDIEIVIADNDPQGSGSTVVEDMRPLMHFPLHYQIEPRSGLSHARNRTLAMAKGDWLAFIDDDEIAEPEWISSHLETAQRLNADVLIGLVNPLFEDGAPGWYIRSGIYANEKQMRQTGETAKVTTTSNAFVRAEPVRQKKLTFDPAYGFSGAEDTDFFLRLGRPVICNREAIVWEIIPPDRTTLESAERRAASFGKAQTSITLARKGVSSLPFLVATALSRMCAGALLTAIFYPVDIARSRFYRVVTIKNFSKLLYLFQRRLDSIYGQS